jgi:glycine oxidase
MADVLVVGAGVMGMLSALRLAQEGLSVCILERGDAGREASWAGGGIVSPLYPWRYSSAVAALAHWSQSQYRQLADSLLQETGIDPGYYLSGLYWLDLEDHEAARSWLCHQQYSFEELPGHQIRGRVPPLSEGFSAGLYLSEVANIRNPHLLKALRAALARCPGVELKECCEVRGLAVENGRVTGVNVADGLISADKVLVTAGAWSSPLLGSINATIPIEPVKGQMILYKREPNFLPAIVLANGRYAIPRKDGYILVGSTLERVGFDKTPTAEALASLKASAETLLPGLAEAQVIGQWAGLRPGSPEGVPFIGEVPEFPGLWLNCGHYRNGLVLAPASCRLLVDLMLGREPIVDPAPYSPAGRLG